MPTCLSTYKLLSNKFFDTRNNWVRKLHPTVEYVLSQQIYLGRENGGYASVYPAKNAVQLALQQPRIPDDGNAQRVAYWQNDQKQAKDLATVTSLGKYLKREFPTLPDYMIRDMVALQAPTKYEIWDTVDQIVQAVQEGPSSCMRWDMDDKNAEHHPYEAYDPKYGWKICVGLDGNGTIIGRALLNDEVFVRCYGLDRDDSICTNDAMAAWLVKEGYKHQRCGWDDGTKLAKIKSHRGYREFLAPYLDGDENRANVSIGDGYLVIDSDGCYSCRCTDGDYEEVERHYCEDCETSVDEVSSVGVNEDRCVCDSCRDSYTYCRSLDGNWCYIRDEDVIFVGSRAYDINYLDDNGIVELHDGEFCSDSGAVYVESESAYYSSDDIGDKPKNEYWTVCLTEGGDYMLRSNCRYCVVTEKWYSKDDMTELLDGTWVSDDSYEEYCFTLTPEQLPKKLDRADTLEILENEYYPFKPENPEATLEFIFNPQEQEALAF